MTENSNICSLPMRRTEQKFLFYDFELYVDELYNNIILYFQFFLTQIHEIIASWTRIWLSSKFLFYDLQLYIDELCNTIVLHFQFCLNRIHQIITSRFFYEKYLTENDEKIVDSIDSLNISWRRFELCHLESGSTRMHGLTEPAMAPFN